MSLSDPSGFRRALPPALKGGFLALALVILSACGFQPLYGDKSYGAGATEKLNDVDIGGIPDREGQKLRNLLIDRFYPTGRPSSTRYRLEVSLSATEQKLALQKDASAVRAQLNVTAPYRLIDTTNGAEVFRANARTIISYNVLEQHYAGVLTVENAYDRGLLEVANDITTRIAMHLGRQP